MAFRRKQGGEQYRIDSTGHIITFQNGDNADPGLPSTDFDAQPRIMNGTVDISADELQVKAAPKKKSILNFSSLCSNFSGVILKI